jgi:hypothetical protein
MSMNNVKNNYTVLDFLNDGIWVLSRVVFLYIVVIAGVAVWGIYNPKIMTGLVAIQKDIMRIFT